jgi:hypothetical protein
MFGRIQDCDIDIAEFEYLAVAHTSEWECDLGFRAKHVLGASCCCQCTTRGDVVRMKVRR